MAGIDSLAAKVALKVAAGFVVPEVAEVGGLGTEPGRGHEGLGDHAAALHVEFVHPGDGVGARDVRDDAEAVHAGVTDSDEVDFHVRQEISVGHKKHKRRKTGRVWF